MGIAGIVTTVAMVSFADSEMWFKRPSSQFIFHAVLEGLYEDGVSNEVIDSIIPPSKPDGSGGFKHSFVFACPLCHPAYEAMKLYRTRHEFYGQKPRPNRRGVDAFGAGLPESLETRLLSTNEDVRRPALQDLIQRFVSRRVERLRLTDAERNELALAIEESRKEGEQSLKNAAVQQSNSPVKNWMSCAVCDGSFNACPRPTMLQVPSTTPRTDRTIDPLP